MCGDCNVFFCPDEKKEMLQKYSSLAYTILFIDINYEKKLRNLLKIKHLHLSYSMKE